MTITGTVARYAVLRTARAHAIVTRVHPGAEHAPAYVVEVHPAPTDHDVSDPRDPHAWAARAQFTRCATWREATAYAARALTTTLAAPVRQWD